MEARALRTGGSDLAQGDRTVQLARTASQHDRKWCRDGFVTGSGARISRSCKLIIGLGWIASPGEIVCAYPFLLSVDRLLCAADHLEQWLARESPHLFRVSG